MIEYFARCVIYNPTRFTSASESTSGDVFEAVASVDEFIEGLFRSAEVNSWAVVNADEVLLAVVRGPEEPYRSNELSLGWTTEPKVGGCVTFLNQIGPIALVGGTVESKTVRTFQDVSAAVVAVHKTTAICSITQFVVSELMGTVFRWNSRLGSCSAAAVYVNRVLARVGEQTCFIVEQ